MHELWSENEVEQLFCLAGRGGEEARSQMEPDAELIWSISATSHYEAMEKYYQHMGWGYYASEFLVDRFPYDNK
ncbi:hypothetical protein FS373_06205 [Shewanella sp. YLB-07]|nr:hypothetical protein [Shewanella sp. YLB-07]MPY22197.1 hypothetical protein [Shewanella sp. YLB-07]